MTFDLLGDDDELEDRVTPVLDARGALRGYAKVTRDVTERLEAEAGNLAAAVGWYLAHHPTPLPHLFRVLWLFWSARDHLGEARAWVDQLLRTGRPLPPAETRPPARFQRANSRAAPSRTARALRSGA